jgi:hypothetical protein
MATNNDLGLMAKERASHLACGVMDSLFLALWAVPNVGLEHLAPLVEKLTGIDKVVLVCLQVLFGFSTLAPVGIWIYKDIRIMLIRANGAIREAKNTTAEAAE